MKIIKMPNKITQLECDYLVIGAGATGMAFVDEMIHGSDNIKIVLVDKRAKPGGHWVDAYPFVRLHQPAAWYGVNSKPLGSGGADLSSKAQILAYYELIIDDLVTTGRLTYLPQCEYQGKGQVKSLLDEDIEYQVNLEESTLKRILAHEFDGVNLIPNYNLCDIHV